MRIPTADLTAELNVTPLIDVMLVLVVFLLVTLPLQLHVVNLNFGSPQAFAPPIVDNLEIQFDGTLIWNGRTVSREALDRYLSSAAQHQPMDEVHISIDRLAHYGVVAKIMADAQQRGETNMGFVNPDRYVR